MKIALIYLGLSLWWQRMDTEPVVVLLVTEVLTALVEPATVLPVSRRTKGRRGRQEAEAGYAAPEDSVHGHRALGHRRYFV